MDKTLKHYRIYCWLNMAWYGFLCVIGFTGLFLARSLDSEAMPPDSRDVFQLASFSLVVMGVGFGLGNLSLIRLPKSPKAHLAHFVNICLGISTCILAPYCIWLALRWQSPEIKAYFDQPEFKL